MRRKQAMTLLTAAWLGLGINGMAAYASTFATVENRFQMGFVDIHVAEYQLQDGVEVAWVDSPMVLPGDCISKIPKITADGQDCYIRAKVQIHDTDAITEENLYGISSDWVKAADGYYYYTQVLRSGESVDLFEGVQIPSDLTPEMQGKQFSMDVNVEAIQADHWNANYQSDSPWGDVDIQIYTKKASYQQETTWETPVSFFVTYAGDSQSLVTNAEDFFQNIPTLMPGDVYTDSAYIWNNSEEIIPLYFKTAITEESILLDAVLLKITYMENGKNTLLYEGSIAAKSLQDGTLLTTLSPYSEGKLEYQVTVPETLDNEYTSLNSQVQWIFSTDTSSLNVGQGGETGDKYTVALYGLGLALGSGVMLILLQRRKQKNKEESCGENE